MLKDDFRLKRGDLWHLILPLVVLVTSLPYVFSSWSEKIRVASEIIQSLHYVVIYKPTIIHSLIPNSMVYISRDFLIFIYLVFTIPLFIRYIRQAKERSVIFGQDYMIKWIIVFQFFFFLLVVGHILVMIRATVIDDPDVVYTENKVQIIASIGLIGLLISPFFFPEILYGLPRLPNHFLKNGNGNKNQFDQTSKNRNAHLKSEYLHLIEQKVDQCMMEKQPFLQKDFNLTELSVMVHIPAHHLAIYFREEKGQSFTNYRNQWRVEYAKNLIDEGKAKELTLEAIGMLSGFANRNSFIVSFKRFEGGSPHEYLSGNESS